MDFRDPTSLLPEISTSRLKEMWKTCICSALAWYLEQIKKICFVMNWKNPWNFTDFMDNWWGIYTKVTVV